MQDLEGSVDVQAFGVLKDEVDIPDVVPGQHGQRPDLEPRRGHGQLNGGHDLAESVGAAVGFVSGAVAVQGEHHVVQVPEVLAAFRPEQAVAVHGGVESLLLRMADDLTDVIADQRLAAPDAQADGSRRLHLVNQSRDLGGGHLGILACRNLAVVAARVAAVGHRQHDVDRAAPAQGEVSHAPQSHADHVSQLHRCFSPCPGKSEMYHDPGH